MNDHSLNDTETNVNVREDLINHFTGVFVTTLLAHQRILTKLLCLTVHPNEFLSFSLNEPHPCCPAFVLSLLLPVNNTFFVPVERTTAENHLMHSYGFS